VVSIAIARPIEGMALVLSAMPHLFISVLGALSDSVRGRAMEAAGRPQWVARAMQPSRAQGARLPHSRASGPMIH
jgi:hypothetical protein